MTAGAYVAVRFFTWWTERRLANAAVGNELQL